MDLFDKIKGQIEKGDYAVSDHAIIEARKDGIDPQTVEKLEKVVLNDKIIEEYPERQRVLMYGVIAEDDLPVHVVVDYSEVEEAVFVTSYVPDSRDWIKFQIRKK